MHAGDVWRALSIRRAADTVAAFEAPIASGEHVKDIPGIGKKIMKWVLHCRSVVCYCEKCARLFGECDAYCPRSMTTWKSRRRLAAAAAARQTWQPVAARLLRAAWLAMRSRKQT